mgnify:CR=1 FL=1
MNEWKLALLLGEAEKGAAGRMDVRKETRRLNESTMNQTELNLILEQRNVIQTQKIEFLENRKIRLLNNKNEREEKRRIKRMKIQGKRERRRRRNVARLMKFEKLTRTKAEAIAKQVDLTEQLEIEQNNKNNVDQQDPDLIEVLRPANLGKGTEYCNNECTLTELEPGTIYVYKIRAFNDVGWSEWSEICPHEMKTLPLEPWVPPTHPLLITNDLIIIEDVSTSGFDLKWIPPYTSGSSILGYQIQQNRQSIDPNDEITLLDDVTGWHDVAIGAPAMEPIFGDDGLTEQEMYDQEHGVVQEELAEKTQKNETDTSRPSTRASTRSSRPNTRGSLNSAGSMGSVSSVRSNKPNDSDLLSSDEEEDDELILTKKDGIELVVTTTTHVPFLVCGTQYIFRMRCCNSVGWSPWTESSPIYTTAAIEPNCPLPPSPMSAMTTSTALS